MMEIRFDKTKDEVALLIWFLVDHSVFRYIIQVGSYAHERSALLEIQKPNL
jgi:hypothetical protein